MHLYLIRHGRTYMNESGLLNGHLSDPLNDVGKQQIQIVAEKLSGIPFDAIRASDLDRAHDTANAIAQKHNILVQTDARLRERHFGEFQGKSGSDLRDLAMKKLGLKPSACYDQLGVGIEGDDDIKNRVLDWFTTSIQNAGHENICVVSHGATLRVFISHILNIPASKYFSYLQGLENTSITKIRYLPEHEKRIIETFNDYSHLPTAA